MSIPVSTVQRAPPTAVADGTNIKARFARYGENFIIPVGSDFQAIAEEGLLFRGLTPTIFSAINMAGATQTTWVATTPTITLRNSDSAGGKRIFPIACRFIFQTAGTAGTRIEGAITLDNTTRYSSGGTALTIVNSNMDLSTATIGVAHAGAITATAASGSVRNVARFTLSTTIPAVGESYTITFGQQNGSNHIGKGADVAPVVIGPSNHTMLIYLWSPSQSATPTVEVELVWAER